MDSDLCIKGPYNLLDKMDLSWSTMKHILEELIDLENIYIKKIYLGPHSKGTSYI